MSAQEKLQEYGIYEDKVGEVAFQLDYLRGNGLLVDVTVTGIGLFTKSAELAELGVKDEAKERRYSGGSKYLIPKVYIDRLRSIETRLRQAHVKFTFDVMGFKPYRWLPYTAYHAYKSRFQDLQAEFEIVKGQIISNLDKWTDLLAEEFGKGARKTWEALQGQGYGGIIYKGRGYIDQDGFVDAVIKQALDQFPTVAEVQKALTCDYSVSIIQSDINIAAEREAAQAKKKAAYEELMAANEARLLASETLEHTKAMNDLEQQERSLQIAAMYEAELAHAKEQISEMRAPFDEVFQSMRAQMATAAAEIEQSISKNGFVRGKVAEKAAGLLDFFKIMSVYNDQELHSKLVELRNKIGVIGEERSKDAPTRSPEEISKILTDIVALAAIEAGDLEAKSRAAFLEI